MKQACSCRGCRESVKMPKKTLDRRKSFYFVENVLAHQLVGNIISDPLCFLRWLSDILSIEM